MSDKTQQARILERLRQGPLTHLEAETELGVMRLAARVGELRAMGYPIHKALIKVTNRHGEECRIARYTLTQKEDQAA